MIKMKTSKKLLSVMSVIFSLLVIFTCVAFAATSASVDITPNKLSAVTDEISAKRVKYSGHNNKSSKRNLYFNTQYKDGNTWRDSDSLLVMPGINFNNMLDDKTYFTSSSHQWRLELNPYGVGLGGCSGSGTIDAVN